MSPPPRSTTVLMTADAVGGVWTYCLNLAHATRRRGIRFVVATMGPRPSPAQLSDAASHDNIVLEQSDFPLEWMAEPWSGVSQAGEWLLELEQRHSPDIVHLNGYAHGVLPFASPKLIVGHSCCLSWWRALREGPPPPGFGIYHEHASRGLAAADAFVAPTYAMMAEYRSIYALPPLTKVIRNGASGRGARVPKQPVCLCAGRAWDEAKNISCVAQAAPAIPWPVQLAGDLASPLGTNAAPDGLTCLGRLSSREMHSALARSSIYIHPARYEPFGLLPLEAALHRCALVLADTPTMRELWDSAAAFFPPNRPDLLSATVRALISNPARLHTLAALAHARASRFSLSRFGAEYARLYDHLLSRHSPPDTHQEPSRACAPLSSITRS